jgi:hypothetical protein
MFLNYGKTLHLKCVQMYHCCFVQENKIEIIYIFNSFPESTILL